MTCWHVTCSPPPTGCRRRGDERQRQVLRCGAVQGDRAGEAAPRARAVVLAAARPRVRDVAGCAASADGGSGARRHSAGQRRSCGRSAGGKIRRAGLVRACMRWAHRGRDGSRAPAGRRTARPADRAGRHSAGRAARHSRASGRPDARRRPSRSCRRATRWAPMRSCVRRPTRCHCGSARTVFSRILRRPEHAAIEPEVIHLPRIALDIDTPEDLALFLATPSRTSARALLDRWGIRADRLAVESEKAGV